MFCREVLQGQKLLGWVLILMGLLLLMVVGLAQGLVARYSLPWLETFASWAPNAWWNRTVVGIVAWLLLAGGYVFLLSALIHERLHDIEGQLEERVSRLARDLAALRRGQGEGDPLPSRCLRGDPLQ
jgi:hypothetical protein